MVVAVTVIKNSISVFAICTALVLAATTKPANAQVQVAVIGDSNVYGKGVVTSENYPSQLESALDARGLNVRTSNGGINGDVSAGLLARLDSAVPQGTKVAVIWIGINDYRRGVALPEIRTNVTEIVRRLRSRGIDSYVIRPPVYDVADHRNPSLSVPDHFQRRRLRKEGGQDCRSCCSDGSQGEGQLTCGIRISPDHAGPGSRNVRAAAATRAR